MIAGPVGTRGTVGAVGALPRSERTVWRPAPVGRRDGVPVATETGVLVAVLGLAT